MIVNDLEKCGIAFKSVSERTDTTFASGKLIFHVFASMAEFEHNVIHERTNGGLAAAWARRRKAAGRPSSTRPSEADQGAAERPRHQDPRGALFKAHGSQLTGHAALAKSLSPATRLGGAVNPKIWLSIPSRAADFGRFRVTQSPLPVRRCWRR